MESCSWTSLTSAVPGFRSFSTLRRQRPEVRILLGALNTMPGELTRGGLTAMLGLVVREPRMSRLAHFRLRVSTALILCCVATVAVAQAQPTPDAVSQTPSAPIVKAKKPLAKRASSVQASPKSTSLGDDKAARLAEGRKKFFEQSSGFEDRKSDLPLSMGNDGKPSMGLKF